MAPTGKGQNREIWLDVAKGLGIIGVVVGHTDLQVVKYIYWFHMPLFFALSGYLFKPVENASEIVSWIAKRARQLLIPYISFVVLLLIARSIQHPPRDIHRFLSDLAGIAAGGRLIPGEYVGLYAPIWFITCLFFTQTLFMLITFRFKSNAARMFVVLVAYVLAHIESGLIAHHRIWIPWNADVTLMALSYYGFGFFGRPILSGKYRPGATVMLSALASLVFLFLDLSGKLDYQLDLKYVGYRHLILDLAIPLAWVIAVTMISRWVSQTPVASGLAFLGAASLPIMYMHMYANQLVSHYIDYGPAVFTLIGLVVPLGIWSVLLQRFSITRRYLLGIK